MLVPKIPALRRQRQGECESQASPGYTGRTPHRKQKSGDKHKDFLISEGVIPYIPGRGVVRGNRLCSGRQEPTCWVSH